MKSILSIARLSVPVLFTACFIVLACLVETRVQTPGQRIIPTVYVDAPYQTGTVRVMKF